MMFRALLAGLMVSAIIATANSQQGVIDTQEPSGAGLILGQVIDPGTGRGVPGAVVSISGPPIAAGPTPPAGPPSRPQVLTTAEGRFLFRDLRKGAYSLSATRPGYLAGAYGARRPGGGSAPLDLDDGQHVTDVVIPLWRWGAASGTVVDEAGEPLAGLEVRAYRRGGQSAGRQFQQAGIDTTDDRGAYRISGLTPGEHVVAVLAVQSSVPTSVADALHDAIRTTDASRSSLMSALFELGGRMPAPAGTPGVVQLGSSLQHMTGATPPPMTGDRLVFVYPTTFHPAVRTAREATAIPIRSGEDRTGIDIELKTVRVTSISGTVTGPDGPAAHIGLRLDLGTDDVTIEPEATTLTDAAGAFIFPSVPAGQYTLRARRTPRPLPTGAPVTIIQSGGMTISSSGFGPGAPPPPLPEEPTLWANVPLSVGPTPITGVTITLQVGARVRGRVEFDGTAGRPDPAQLQRIAVFVEPETGPMQRGVVPPSRVGRDGEFATGGVPGGRYFIRSPGGPSGWIFKGAMHEGVDLADTPVSLEGRDLNGVTLVFSDRPTEISGTVRDGDGAPDRNASILIFPVEPERWRPNSRRLRSVRTSQSGLYTAAGIPPGDYYFVAVSDESAVEWQDPAVLESYAAAATRVSLDDGEKRVQDLRTQQHR